MSSGKVHTRVTLLIAAEFTVATIVSLDPSNLQYVVGALLGVFLQPDLDVNHGKVEASRIIRARLGLVPYIGWNGLWYMYRRSLKHGGDLSHFPIVGTLGRLCYLFLFAIVVPYIFLAYVFHFDFWYEVEWWFWQVAIHYKVILALMVTDLFHWIMDISTKEHRNERAPRISVSRKPMDG